MSVSYNPAVPAISYAVHPYSSVNPLAYQQQQALFELMRAGGLPNVNPVVSTKTKTEVCDRYNSLLSCAKGKRKHEDSNGNSPIKFSKTSQNGGTALTRYFTEG